MSRGPQQWPQRKTAYAWATADELAGDIAAHATLPAELGRLAQLMSLEAIDAHRRDLPRSVARTGLLRWRRL